MLVARCALRLQATQEFVGTEINVSFVASFAKQRLFRPATDFSLFTNSRMFWARSRGGGLAWPRAQEKRSGPRRVLRSGRVSIGYRSLSIVIMIVGRARGKNPWQQAAGSNRSSCFAASCGLR